MPDFTDVTFTDGAVLLDGVEYDRWIFGEGADSATEYVIHLSEPRFLAKYWDGAEDSSPCTLSSLCVVIGATEFFDIVWFDAPPNEQDTLTLFQAADAALTRYSFKD